jgi:hypothetical protein
MFLGELHETFPFMTMFLRKLIPRTFLMLIVVLGLKFELAISERAIT